MTFEKFEQFEAEVEAYKHEHASEDENTLYSGLSGFANNNGDIWALDRAYQRWVKEKGNEVLCADYFTDSFTAFTTIEKTEAALDFFGVDELVITDSSTALMQVLDRLVKLGWKMIGMTEVIEYKNGHYDVETRKYEDIFTHEIILRKDA